MGTLLLRSNNLHDIQAAINLGGWTHTKSSSRIKVGDTLVVFGNKGECKKAGIPFDRQVVLIGRLERLPYKLDSEDERWPSNETGTDKEYLVRYDLSAMDLVPFNMIPGAYNSVANVRGHLNGGKYIH